MPTRQVCNIEQNGGTIHGVITITGILDTSGRSLGTPSLPGSCDTKSGACSYRYFSP
jgi:hypothetical protein